MRLVDSDGSGTIEKSEFFNFLNSSESPQSQKSSPKIFRGSTDAIESAKRALNQSHQRLTCKNKDNNININCKYF